MWVKSGPNFSATSFGTAKEKLSANTCSMVALGSISWNTTVWSSGVVMPDISVTLPSSSSWHPMMPVKKLAPGDWVLGLQTRSIEYLMSAAVSSRPLWNLTPLRSLKV